MNPSRRDVLAAALLAAACGAGGARAGAPQRIAVLDWALAELVLALGVRPVAVAETALYAGRVGEPALPPGTIDLGLRSQPSLERLASIRPDLILALSGYGPAEGRLRRIAPTLALEIYGTTRRPLDRSQEALRTIAAATGREAAGRDVIERFDAAMETQRRRLEAWERRPILVLNFVDERHADVYGRGSLFDAVFTRLGLDNAFSGATNPWGFSTIGLGEIAARSGARLLMVSPGLPDGLAGSALWRSLPSVRAGRVSVLPPVWQFGALTAAERFATVLADSLAPS
ncbi:ABC transporter substrate-binding protein [Aureimonas flava]|uniref:ABC transporter substrate-binding protein n=1 Tax=Aureimonas flava TaxID=2320271 RepID=A0A3A1WMI0_9HYPH|nr:ABC transporter substrate-binding protein [Aureimonas flava]RIY01061.1 ABC transporter substrate-binding protein [Aureimonas flava]